MTRPGRPPVPAADIEARRAAWVECRRALGLPLADLARIAGLLPGTARVYSGPRAKGAPSWAAIECLRAEILARRRAEVARRAAELADAEAALARLESETLPASFEAA